MQGIYIDDIGSGFPLILVHGYLGSSEMWSLQKEFLSKHFRIITPALPGFGESYKAQSLNSINEIAKFVSGSMYQNPVNIPYINGLRDLTEVTYRVISRIVAFRRVKQQ